MAPVVEQRIAGWIQRALEIHGCRQPAVNITKSLTKGDPCTELDFSWS
jgi:hypothetical protein